MEEIISTPQKGAARNIARKLIKDAKIKDLPVSLQKVLDFLKTKSNLQIYEYKFGEKVSGMLVMIGDEATIGFNKNQHWYRRRFTISHEIGHLLMGHTCSPEDKGSIKEIESNQFAAELLVPLALIKKDFKLSQNLEDLSKKYAVSTEALTRHLIDCRLV
ncbi:MAG: ImmA/IrrE family metallo-endopeptidase [Candidatus Moraniibacteriota bacterium]|nr:MAG: ImmA/IrrE family metallo-endopeptidase [Candidatus Moranbacteria bacterium]